MFEAIVLFILSGLIAACACSSQGGGLSFFGKLFRSAKGQTPATLTSQTLATDGAEPTPSFLEQLQGEIEATLFPRPTDSVLRRHYDALVAVEVKNRLSFFS